MFIALCLKTSKTFANLHGLFCFYIWGTGGSERLELTFFNHEIIQSWDRCE